MINRYVKGYTFENKTIQEIRNHPGTKIADRFLKSIGPYWKPDYENFNRFGNYKTKHAPVDIWWIDNTGVMNFAQLKSGDFGITTEQMLDLIMFAWDMNTAAAVHLYSKRKGKIHKWQISNKTVD